MAVWLLVLVLSGEPVIIPYPFETQEQCEGEAKRIAKFARGLCVRVPLMEGLK